MKLSLGNMYQFLRDIAHVVIYGELDSPDVYVIDDKEVVFVSVAKSASTSIKSSIYGDPPPGVSIHHQVGHNAQRKIPKQSRHYFAFTIVRDPYRRLASCYKNKFNMEDESKFIYSKYLLGYLKNDDTFEEFVRKVSKIPDILSDRHFKSQKKIISRSGRVDFIGKVENLQSDYEKIRQRYGFNELKKRNQTKGKSPEEMYTDETRALTYQRYKIDFDEYDYPE